MKSGNIFFTLSLLAVTTCYTTGCGSSASKAFSGSTTTPAPTSTPTSTLASVTISSPSNNSAVSSPFQLTASAPTCSSQTVTSIGYALDSSTTPAISSGTALTAKITASSGTHTVQVTAWGSDGATCTASVSVSVTDPASPVNSLIPSDAVSVANIEQLSNWKYQHDPATGSSSSGTSSLVSSPVLSGKAREFNTTFAGSGGELYYVSFASDESATNFFYDGWVYIDSSVSSIANLEMDMNQVVADGDTIIYGFQCDGYSGTWDYTENKGTPSKTIDTWIHSSAACDVRKWAQNAWHHVQISYSRDDSGNVTYNSVWLDGTESKINATVPSDFALGWGSVLLTNFQIDGLGAGSDTIYLNQLTISRW